MKRGKKKGREGGWKKAGKGERRGTSKRKILHRVIVLTQDKSVRCFCFHAQASVSDMALKGHKGHSVGREHKGACCLCEPDTPPSSPSPSLLTGLPCSQVPWPPHLSFTQFLDWCCWTPKPFRFQCGCLHPIPTSPGLPGSSAVVARSRKFAVKYLAWQEVPYYFQVGCEARGPSSILYRPLYPPLTFFCEMIFPPSPLNIFTVEGPFVMKLLKI